MKKTQSISNTRSAMCAVWCMIGLFTYTSSADANKLELATLQEEVSRLSRENMKFKESLIASNKREEQVARKLARVKTRMGALGKSLLSEDQDQRLLAALTEIEYLQERVEKLEGATIDLTDNYRKLISTVLVSDPDARTEMEVSLRQAETALGFRYQPSRPIEAGTLQEAQIVSIDQESGLVVLNVGRENETRIGMRFSIKRGSLDIATGIVAEVRPSVSGMLIQELNQKDLLVQIGDTAKVVIN